MVEDDFSIAELIALYFREAGIDPLLPDSAEETHRRIAERTVYLVVLDLNLSGADGIAFREQFRATHSTPVIIVSARDGDEDKVAGLMSGADDFLTKPFSPKVLLAHARAKLRYLDRNAAPSVRRYKFGPFIVDLDAYQMTRGAERVSLAPKEFDLLALSLERRSRRGTSAAFVRSGLGQPVWRRVDSDRTRSAPAQETAVERGWPAADRDSASRWLPCQRGPTASTNVKLRTTLALMIVTVTAVLVLVTWLLGYVDVGTRSAADRAEASGFLATQLWLRDEIVPAWDAVAAGADLELLAERTVLVVDVTGRILLSSWPGATRRDRLAERGLSFVPERLLSVAELGQQASVAARGSLAR